MQKIFYIVMVVLAYAALMLVTMAPHVDTSHCDQFQGDPHRACVEAAEMQGDHSGMTGDHSGMTGDHSGMTGGGDDGVALTIGDPRCIVGAAMRDPRCPNANMP